MYIQGDGVVKQFGEDDYEKDEKQKTIVLTEDGTERAERMLEAAGVLIGANLYDFENTQVVHHLNQSLRANKMFKLDTDYIVKDDKVVITDEFTGRMTDGRRRLDEHTSELLSLMRIPSAFSSLNKQTLPNNHS